MHLEPATPADVSALHALVESAYRGDSARRGWSHEADLLDGQRTDQAALAAMVADPAQHLLVFRDNDRLRACVAQPVIVAKHQQMLRRVGDHRR